MSYIKRPEPSDSEVIYAGTEGEKAFTWGDHRAMEAMLSELEAESPAALAARKRLDKAMEDWSLDKTDELICEYCWQPESRQHEKECRDYDDPALHVRREAGGYQYVDENFRVIHVTSVPMTDQEALEYFSLVDSFIIECSPKYITKREMNDTKYQMMPFWYEPISNTVLPIEKKS